MPAPDYRVLDLFSGIGGFSLGLERAGMETVAFCEMDGYARRVLKKHWPDVWLYDDVRTLTKKRLKADGLSPNVVCGGFPCQDISTAGKGAGIEGARSGLWSEMLRIVKEIRPAWVIAENVPALRGRGADRVLADLEGAGYAAVPSVVGAWAVGGDHQRDRVWIVAHSVRDRKGPAAGPLGGKEGLQGRGRHQPPVPALDGSPHVADAQGVGRRDREQSGPVSSARALARPDREPVGRWQAEPAVGRVADGVPSRVDRLRCLGNAVVPLIPELIGRAVIDFDRREAALAVA